jgi:hypothetical protein
VFHCMVPPRVKGRPAHWVEAVQGPPLAAWRVNCFSCVCAFKCFARRPVCSTLCPTPLLRNPAPSNHVRQGSKGPVRSVDTQAQLGGSVKVSSPLTQAGPFAAGKGAKGTMGKSKSVLDDKKKPTSRSSRAGLQFPVGRIHRLLKVRAGSSEASNTMGQRRAAPERASQQQVQIAPCLLSPGACVRQRTCRSHCRRVHGRHSG